MNSAKTCESAIHFESRRWAVTKNTGGLKTHRSKVQNASRAAGKHHIKVTDRRDGRASVRPTLPWVSLVCRSAGFVAATSSLLIFEPDPACHTAAITALVQRYKRRLQTLQKRVE